MTTFGGYFLLNISYIMDPITYDEMGQVVRATTDTLHVDAHSISHSLVSQFPSINGDVNFGMS